MMNLKNKIALLRRRHRKGAVLALVIIAVLILSISSMAMLSLSQAAQVRAANNTSTMTARCAADAGIEKMVYLMNQSLKAGTFNSSQLPVITNEPMINANASYTVNFSGNLATGYQITSIGTSGGASRTVRTTVTLQSAFADFAMFGKSSLDFKNKATVYGYNSSDALDTDTRPAIGTASVANGSISCGNLTVINGDAYLFPGAVPNNVIKGISSIEGEIFTLPAPITFPTIKIPTFSGSKGALSGSTLTINSADSGNYTTISASNKLTVNGACSIVVSGDISLGNSATIEISNNSSLNIYLSGKFDGKNSAGVVNKTNIPANFKLYGVGQNQSITLKNSSTLYGAIYAPNADIQIDNGASVYGAVIGNKIELKNSGSMYCDKALKKAQPTDSDAYFAASSWEEL